MVRLQELHGTASLAPWSIAWAIAHAMEGEYTLRRETYDGGLGVVETLTFRGNLNGVLVTGVVTRTKYGVTIDQVTGHLRVGETLAREEGGVWWVEEG